MGAYGTPEHLPNDERQEPNYQYGYGNYDGSQYTDTQRKYKKRGLKGWQIVLITIVVTIACFYAVGSYEISTGRVQTVVDTKPTVSAKGNIIVPQSVAPSSAAEFSISKATYDKAKKGMPYEAIKKLFGSAGKQTSESGEKGDEYYTADYEWSNEDDSICIMMFFLDGKLETKTEYGLE